MKHRFRLGGILLSILASSSVNAQMQMSMPTDMRPKSPKIPTLIADKSRATSPPVPIEPGVRGYGTRGVDGQTLAQMKAACASDAASSDVIVARCDQLRRTPKTTPGNTR